MKSQDWMQIFFFILALFILTPVFALWVSKTLPLDLRGPFSTPSRGRGWMRSIEDLLCKFIFVDPSVEMTWKQYFVALMNFSLVSTVFLMLLQMAQKALPMNPEGVANVPLAQAFNTAVSFVTNTNWQSYSGESSLSYLTQMVGLTVQNFASAGVGICIMMALVRGLTRKKSATIGNFWSDLVRSVVFVLLPLSIVFSIFLIGQGVPQTFKPSLRADTIEGATQQIALGPVASQEAIKQLGTNGGGYYNANSAHPFENPTPLANFFSMLAILLIPSALALAYGNWIGSKRQGYLLWLVMFLILVTGIGISEWAEFQTNPNLPTHFALEGKETRIGVTNSVLWAVSTTAASSGSVNAMHSSMSPLTGGVAMLNMMLGEIVFGGIGSGMYGMILFVLLTVFLAGLMVGRTPEYLGKKIEANEMKMVTLAVVLPGACVLLGTGLSLVLPQGLAGLSHKGPHGFSEILYAFTSAAANNGSAFAGLSANSNYYNYALGIVILLGRFGVIFPVLSIAGSLAAKKIAPPSSGTFPTDGALFAMLLIGVIFIVGALTFFPALSLGPIIEHLLMLRGARF